jgi:excisionase family DNA binding protein
MLLLDLPSVSRELGGLSRKTVDGLIRTGELPSMKIGRRRLVRHDLLAEFVAAREQPSPEVAPESCKGRSHLPQPCDDTLVRSSGECRRRGKDECGLESVPVHWNRSSPLECSQWPHDAHDARVIRALHGVPRLPRPVP